MGRRTLLPVGSTCNGWEITDRTSYSHTSNQQLKLKCLSCGFARTTWSSNLKQDTVRCRVCAGQASSEEKRLSVGSVLAYYGTYIEVFSSEDTLPRNTPLFRLVSSTIATALVIQAKPTIPKPDEGYAAHLKVPAKYIGWYCLEDVTLDTNDSKEAEALYSLLVETPTTAFTKHVRGSGAQWWEGDTEYGYIYWKDKTSWPKASKPVEATSVPTET